MKLLNQPWKNSWKPFHEFFHGFETVKMNLSSEHQREKLGSPPISKPLLSFVTTPTQHWLKVVTNRGLEMGGV